MSARRRTIAGEPVDFANALDDSAREPFGLHADDVPARRVSMTSEQDAANVEAGASRRLGEALIVELARVALLPPLAPTDARTPLSSGAVSAVRDFVEAMRASGMAPERMLVAFKRLIGTCVPAGGSHSSNVERALISEAIRAYFKGSVASAAMHNPLAKSVAGGRRGRGVLVVDDNEDSRFILGVMLQGEGVDALLASNGAEALLIARHADLALILLDLAMPGLDGKQVLLLLRQLSEIRMTPVIAITAFPALVQPPDLLARGFAEVLLKPIGPADLRRVIARFSPELLPPGAP